MLIAIGTSADRPGVGIRPAAAHRHRERRGRPASPGRWSTSNSSPTSCSMMCQDSAGSPGNGCRTGRPQPSSALRYSLGARRPRRSASCRGRSSGRGRCRRPPRRRASSRRATRGPARSRRRTASSTGPAAAPWRSRRRSPGTWVVTIPPTIVGHHCLSRVCSSFALKSSTAHAGLLGADVLHVEAEDAGELGEVVDVAAGRDHAAARCAGGPPRAAPRSARSWRNSRPRRRGRPRGWPRR